jgi:hypothetical protein
MRKEMRELTLRLTKRMLAQRLRKSQLLRLRQRLPK